MNNILKSQSRIRKDSIVAEFYHQCKLAVLDVTVAYRDYDLSDHTIEAVIHKGELIICFVRIRNKTPIRGIIPVFDIRSMTDILPVIKKISLLKK